MRGRLGAMIWRSRTPRIWAFRAAPARSTPHELNFAVALNSTLEGKTDKQKNSHQEASLAWFVVRLGGWSGYQRYRPAGPKSNHTDGINTKP